jgi:hypothetical protein
MDGRCYVAMRLMLWSSLQDNLTGLPVRMSDASVGFMQVYESVEQLRADWPDAEYVTIAARKPITEASDAE